jgi:hypothetical protein
MALEYDPVASLRHFPMALGRFGKNPYGEPLYRIVSADSRRRLVGGFWQETGEVGYHWTRKYKRIEGWILERWQMPTLSKKQWDRDMIDPLSGWLLFGPYPERGEYEMAYHFDAEQKEAPTIGLVEKLIGALERGRSRSFEEVRAAHKAEYDAEERETKANVYDELRDVRQAFGMAPISSARGVSRGTKTLPNVISAQEAGLPIPRRTARKNPVNLRGIGMTTTISQGVRI